jgi:hypothetical protein
LEVDRIKKSRRPLQKFRGFVTDLCAVNQGNSRLETRADLLIAWTIAMDQEAPSHNPIPPPFVNASSPRRKRSGWVQRFKRWFNKIPDRLAERKLNFYQVVVMVLVCYAVYRFVIPMFDRDMGGGGGGQG